MRPIQKEKEETILGNHIRNKQEKKKPCICQNNELNSKTAPHCPQFSEAAHFWIRRQLSIN